MIKNYLFLAVKHLKKQKVISIGNLLELTIGITCCFMIFLLIMNESNHGNFHKNGKDVYRVMRVGNLNGERHEIPYMSPYAPALINDYPDAIKQAVRVMPDNNLISYNNISFKEKKVYFPNSTFFSVFSFPLLRGEATSVLRDPYSIVLTETAAKKYFGKDDPVGKVLEFNKDQQLKVRGITADVPVNSHLHFDMVIPFELLRSIQPDWFTRWPDNDLFTYVQLNASVDLDQLQKKFPAFMDKYFGDYYAETAHKMGLSMMLAGSYPALLLVSFSPIGLLKGRSRVGKIGTYFRKTLGSSIQHIVLLLSKDLLNPVLLGTLVAIPVGYYAMNKWLQNFAYRVNFDWWMFVITVFTAIAIALLTVSFHAIKAAVANPVKGYKQNKLFI